MTLWEIWPIEKPENIRPARTVRLLGTDYTESAAKRKAKQGYYERNRKRLQAEALKRYHDNK